MATSPSVAAYTTTQRVAELLQVAEPTDANDEGEPTKASWTRRIVDVEDEIDRLTGQAWRERKVTDEYRHIDAWMDWHGFVPVNLRHHEIRALDTAQGDKVEVRVGSAFVDYLTTQTQGTTGAFWIQADTGILYLRRRHFPIVRDAIRMAYRYGEQAVPNAIRRLATLMAGIELAQGDRVAVGGRGGGLDRIGLDAKADQWRREADRILVSYAQVGVA